MQTNRIWCLKDVLALADAGLVALPELASDTAPDAPVAFGRLWHAPIRDGLAATGYDLRYLIELETRQVAERSLVVTLLLGGEAAIAGGDGPLLELRERSIGIASFAAGATIRARMKAASHTRLVGLAIGPQFLDACDDEEAGGGLDRLRALLAGGTAGESRQASRRALVLAQQMAANPYRGALGRLYLEGRALSFLVEVARLLDADGDRPGGIPTLPPAQQERICQARQLLESRLADPPSLAELARAVGMSAANLRKSFRQAFGETAFDFVRRRRLEEAHLLLVTQGLSVSEVAWRVGFAEPSNFTAAFRRRFGYPPSRVAVRA